MRTINKNGKKQINVVVCVDDIYSQHLAVMLYSLGINNVRNQVDVYIIYKNLSHTNIDLLETTVRNFNIKLIFILNTYNYLNSVEAGGFSEVAYYRINLPNILSNLDKVLYLDCDIVINHDLAELYGKKVTCIAAVRDANVYLEEYYNRLFSATAPKGYFNSGVMLLNLAEMRHVGASEKIMQYIKENKGTFRWHDQTGLNWFFFKTYESLPPKFNFLQTIYAFKNLKHPLYEEAEYTEARNDPAIIHFAGKTYKPWLYESVGTYKGLYLKYLDNTPYRNNRFQSGNTFSKNLNLLLIMYLPFIFQKLLIDINGLIFLRKNQGSP